MRSVYHEVTWNTTFLPPRLRAARAAPPESVIDGEIPDYDDFLEERRKLMALKIKTWFEAL